MLSHLYPRHSINQFCLVHLKGSFGHLKNRIPAGVTPSVKSNKSAGDKEQKEKNNNTFAFRLKSEACQYCDQYAQEQINQVGIKFKHFSTNCLDVSSEVDRFPPFLVRREPGKRKTHLTSTRQPHSPSTHRHRPLFHWKSQNILSLLQIHPLVPNFTFK